MAAEVIDQDRLQKAFERLETEKNLLATCTELWKSLSNRYSSLEESFLQKSKALDAKFETLDSESKKALEALEQRENSIPERESAAVARVEELKEAGLLEFEKNEVTGNVEIAEALLSYCRKMDYEGLLKFMVTRRKESMTLKAKLSVAINESVDQHRLVLDAMDDFISQKASKVDRRWACGMLLQSLFPMIESGGKPPAVAASIAERAAGVAEALKANMAEAESGGIGPAEAAMFLQMVIGFGLKSRFDEDYLRKLVLIPSRKDMPKLAAALEFGDKIGDIIDEWVKSGKEIEAVYLASESGLTDRFPPLNLIKAYLRNSRKNATTILKNGHYSFAATDQASVLELNSIKAIVKCVEDHNLESEFTLDSLRKRITQLEKAKADRKKPAPSMSKPPNKRPHGGGRGGGPPAFRPAKAGRVSNPYPSFRRNPPPQHQSPAARYAGPYNYPNQRAYEGPPPPSYPPVYGGAHTQSPAAALQQHHPFPPEDMSVGAAQVNVAYGAQPGYGAYDYNTGAPPPTYQPPYPQ